MEPWIMHRGDKPGNVTETNLAATIATLADPEKLSVRVEQAQEVRSDTHRVVFMLTPAVFVHGLPARTAVLINAWRLGSMQKTDPDHPFLDCMAGLHNAHAILDWQKTGSPYRLKHEAQEQRAVYEPGSDVQLVGYETIRTRRLAVAAALGRLGMRLHAIHGSGNSHEYEVERFSRGMRDEPASAEEPGAPITYDAVDLITSLVDDSIDADHPFTLAFCARRNRDNLMQHIDGKKELLIITPDSFRKGVTYDPSALHSYISKNATGRVWDDLKKKMR